MEYKLENLRTYFHGLPWLNETWPELLRFPPRITRNLSSGIRNLATNLSGVRLRFRSTANMIEFEANFSRLGAMHHFTINGQQGCDLYVDGMYWQTLYNKKRSVEKIDLTQAMHETKSHTYEFYFPLYAPLKLNKIKLDAEITPALSYRDPRPIIYYGSSITQGGCASRPGLSYEAILGRKLNFDFVNLGLSGNGLGNLEIAQMMAEVNPLIYILDWGINLIARDTFSTLQERYEKFFTILRKAHPTTPIVMMNIPYMANDYRDTKIHQLANQFRQHIESIYQKVKEMGDTNVWYIAGVDLISPLDRDMYVDGTHPNDVGFKLIAEKLGAFLTNENILQKAMKTQI